jgi:hypothetical protein
MDMPWYQKPALPTLLSVIIGTIGALCAPLVSHEHLLEVAIGLLAGIAALQVGELWQFHARTPKLTRLEEVLSDEILYNHVETIITANAEIEKLATTQQILGSRFRRERERCLESARSTLEELSRGKIRIVDPDAQYKVALDLAASARKSIKTVSYADEEFWTLEAGKRYLDYNESLVKNGGVVQRVFVFDDESSLLAQKDMIQQHIDKGLDIWILPTARMRPADREDFVIYDDIFVRYARPVEFGGSKKEATLEVTPSVRAEFTNRFENLLLRSVPASKYLGQKNLDVLPRNDVDPQVNRLEASGANNRDPGMGGKNVPSHLGQNVIGNVDSGS